MNPQLTIYWARRDLRLTDNPALKAALTHARESGGVFLPVFVLEDYMCAGDPAFQFGYPSRQFLARALPAFATQFEQFALMRGKGAHSIVSLRDILSPKSPFAVFVNEDIYPDFYTQIKKVREAGIAVKLFSDALTISKDTVSGAGTRYSVFTPFKKAVWQSFVNAPLLKKADVKKVRYVSEADMTRIPHTVAPTETALLAHMSVCEVFSAGKRAYDITALRSSMFDLKEWYTTEADARSVFRQYLKSTMNDYKRTRDSLAIEGTSKMSLALAWGLVSSRMLVAELRAHYNDAFTDPHTLRQSHQGAIHYISELIWREFYRYLFFHTPTLMNTEFQERFRGTISWVDPTTAHERFIKWIRGETGYPVVDAAMHELQKTGWMHNRARMIVASILTKNLGVDWRWGQEYFRAMLVDLDEASNNGGWQWGASVGADPKPIRIFNPYLQAGNYDADGMYQKKYLPKWYLEKPPPVLVEHKSARNDAFVRYGLREQDDGTTRDY
jgi:deoxyribodipyrimidine photo-lyase